MSALSLEVSTLLKKSLDKKNSLTNEGLNENLRLLSKWRSVLLQNTLIQDSGTMVRQGIISGLDFLPHSSEGCHVAKLLGIYEQPLQAPLKELWDEKAYENVINIGCAEGYYAVGLARAYKDVNSFAYDTDPAARESCSQLAKKNGVEKRVTVGALFTHIDFQRFFGTNSLVLCDIEGAEKELLDPILAPELAALDIVVESHECLIPGITELLINRFKDTHDIIKIEDNGMRELSGMPSWFYELAHLDQLLSVWEWRSGPTPWLIMRSKQGSV